MDGHPLATSERPIRELEAEITGLAGQLNAANYRWLILIAEFDRRNGWSDAVTRSCAHWLNWKCGIDLGAAREKLRVGHALEGLPRIAAAMARGELSYSKVRALTRIATAATEETLLMIALHGTAEHVEKVVRSFRRAQEAAELAREARQQAHRTVQWRYDQDGSLEIRARLPAETGALFIQAVEAALRHDDGTRAGGTNENDSRNVSAETFCPDPDEPRPRLGMRRADAVAVLAESFLAHGPAALSGGERQQIVVHVDAATLARREPGQCEIEAGPSIAAETARRLGCDASVVTIIEDSDGTPLDVGRKTRSVPPALKRALRSRDRGCRFPGCGHTHYVDAHHIEHWADGGATRLANLVTLCRFHHRKLHEGGYAIRILDDGALRFLRPDGRALDASHQRAAAQQPSVLAHDPAIARDAAITRWRGERIDYGLAIDVLLAQDAATGGPSPATHHSHPGASAVTRR